MFFLRSYDGLVTSKGARLKHKLSTLVWSLKICTLSRMSSLGPIFWSARQFSIDAPDSRPHFCVRSFPEPAAKLIALRATVTAIASWNFALRHRIIARRWFCGIAGWAVA